jgi:hypothetical protein
MRKTRPALFRARHFQNHVIVLCVRWYLRYCPDATRPGEMTAKWGLGRPLYDGSLGAALRPRNCINGFAAIPGTPTARGGSTKPTSASLGNGPIYIGRGFHRRNHRIPPLAERDASAYACTYDGL